MTWGTFFILAIIVLVGVYGYRFYMKNQNSQFARQHKDISIIELDNSQKIVVNSSIQVREVNGEKPKYADVNLGRIYVLPGEVTLTVRYQKSGVRVGYRKVEYSDWEDVKVTIEPKKRYLLSWTKEKGFSFRKLQGEVVIPEENNPFN